MNLRTCLPNLVIPLSLAVAGPGRAARDPATEATWPAVALSNGVLRLSAYVPVPGRGWYQGVRFDWSSLLGDIDVAGHRYFVNHHAGPHNPHGHDHVYGPAEEFDLDTPPPGFAAAAPGDPFLKIGVGVLWRKDDRDYAFSRAYHVLDHGVWRFEPLGTTGVVYRHTAALPDGRWGYALERRLTLDPTEPVIRIARRLRNTGTERLRTRHYGHHFVQIGGHPIGREYRLELPFAPTLLEPAEMPLVGLLDGKYLRLQPETLERTFWVRLGGFGGDAAENVATVRHMASGAAVTFATDRPLADFRVYATQRVFCPEAFCDFDLAPGEEAAWNSTIRFEPPRAGVTAHVDRPPAENTP